MIHTVKGFGIVNKAEIDVFLELSRFFHDPADVDNLISGAISNFASVMKGLAQIMPHDIKPHNSARGFEALAF